MSEALNWDEVDPATVDFVFYQAEKYLDAQMACGTASDQRAITAASILAGLSSLVLAGSIGSLVGAQPLPLLVAGLGLGTSLMISAVFCYRAARPVDFHASGNQPEMWLNCLDVPLHVSKGHEIENYQEKIALNESVLDASAKQLQMGMNTAFVSPFVGLAVGVVTYFFS